jgi:hypothetical protein
MSTCGCHPREIGREVRLLTDVDGSFEQGECPGQVPLAEVDQPKPMIGPREAVGVRQCLGKLSSFFPQRPSHRKHAELRMAQGEEGPREDRRRGALANAHR